MPNTLLSKSIHLCCSIIKRPQPQPPPQPPHDHHHPSQPTTTTTTTTTTTATFVANYNSLYDSSTYYSAPSSPPPSYECGEATYRVWGFDKPVKLNRVHDTKLENNKEVGPTTATVPDMTAVYASRRFFISCPGLSNSILATENDDVAAGGVPVRTYSPDPYGDFRRSMEEMVVARDLEGASKEEAWEYLQELLFSYLALNAKSTHKYVIAAFVDLLISLLSSSSTISSCYPL